MSTSLPAEQKFFGLFEIDPAGTVLYARFGPEGRPGAPGPAVTGRNFYAEVAPFANVEEFRRRVVRFTRGPGPADSFNFDCQYEGGALPVKVLLARVRERASNERTKSVLIHIRKGS